MKKIFLTVGLVGVGCAQAFSAVAASGTLPDSPVKSWENVVSILTKAATWMYQAFFIIAIFYFLWGAFTFLQAGGDTTKVAEGKKRLLYGVIAVIIALVSTGAAQLINASLKNAAGN
jgi:opacity protein-like surface antigen